MPRRTRITIRGLKRVVRNLKKVDANIKGPVRKKMLQEMGKKTKSYAQQEISKISLSGGLLKDMHYRVFPDRVSIFVGAGHQMEGYAWDRGMSHRIHRSMISESGYTVGDWMDAKGFNPNVQSFWVGKGTPIGKGIRYMDMATIKLNKAMPSILKKYSQMIAR